MAQYSKEVKIGITVGIALFILGWGINFLKGKDIFQSGYKVYGVYPRIDGLTEASPIFFKGFKIGSVRDISLMNGGDSEFMVTMLIEKEIEFTKTTVAQIYSLDLMGSKGIRLLYGEGNVLLESGDTLATSLTGDLADKVSMEVLPLKDKVEKMVVGLDSVLHNLNRLLNDDNKDGLSSGINDFAGMMHNLNQMSASINHSLKKEGSLDNSLANMDSLTTMLKSNGTVLSSMLANLNKVSGQLAEAHIDSLTNEMNTTFTSVNSLLGSLNDGDGTMGKLLKDEELYNNLNDVSVSLDRLLNDVRVQPKRYVNVSLMSFGSGKAKQAKDSTMVYAVLLTKEKYPLDIRNKEIRKGLFVDEIRDGKYYLYTVGQEEDYSSILELKGRIVDLYPEAEILEIKGHHISKK
ncbi:MlaD family protein [Labilibacter marinus]|uniref:MlaD family protein n=1 Tax=Labilibacter marinus TaxID=1477105 RepID=UPI00094F753A|nr:MlaD family protein [Labilibacter marinus]